MRSGPACVVESALEKHDRRNRIDETRNGVQLTCAAAMERRNLSRNWGGSSSPFTISSIAVCPGRSSSSTKADLVGFASSVSNANTRGTGALVLLVSRAMVSISTCCFALSSGSDSHISTRATQRVPSWNSSIRAMRFAPFVLPPTYLHGCPPLAREARSRRASQLVRFKHMSTRSW